MNLNKLNIIAQIVYNDLNNALKIKGVSLSTKGIEVFGDSSLNKFERYGFYAWASLNNKWYGASCDYLGNLTSEEYGYILNIMRKMQMI